MPPTPLTIDGREGEGGGQLLRTSLSLSVLTGRPWRMEHIRAGRSQPGLRPQHLTAVRAAAALCAADLQGDSLNSQTLEFRPRQPAQAGQYRFDVNDHTPHHSAGAVTLIWQTVVWPLLFAGGPSHVVLRGGTHVPFSPTFDYVNQVVRPNYGRMGVNVALSLDEWGWMAHGGGQLTAVIQPLAQLTAADFTPQPVDIVRGEGMATNLPADIPQRLANRAANLVRQAGLAAHIHPIRQRSTAAGAAILLWLPQAGFSQLGEQGLPAQTVAERAVADLLAFVGSGAAVDEHLADQLLLPMSLAHGRSHFTTQRLTPHTLTNAQLIGRWLGVKINITGTLGRPAEVRVEGWGWGN